jgi:catechol 2,3-dioxygenase-like lactoylglutathione lyase family enzyme
MTIHGVRPNLFVGDLFASLRFYAESLGFHVGWQWSDRRDRFLSDDEHIEPGEPGTAQVGRDGALIILTQTDGVHTTRLHFDVVAAADVDGLFAEWQARGVHVAEPPFVRPWGMYEMRLHDPDGHVLRVSAAPG